MGREVKRVPLDFEWPKSRVWEGFLTPKDLHGEPCKECSGSGQTHFGWWLQKFSYVMSMLASDVRDQEQGKPMHPWLAQFPHPHGHWDYYVPDEPRMGGNFVIDRPGPDALEFFAKLSGRDAVEVGGVFMWGDIRFAVMTRLLELTGTDIVCKTCDGNGEHERYEGQRKEREAWEPYEPPEGPGWQLWETVSEGSPISPVFDAPEKLAHWMTTPDYSWGATKEDADRPSYEGALAFVRAGWAPTSVGTSQGVQDGVKAVGGDA